MPERNPSSLQCSATCSTSTQSHASTSRRHHGRRARNVALALLVSSLAAFLSVAPTTASASSLFSRQDSATNAQQLARADPFAPWPDSVDYYNPRDNGGSMLSITGVPGKGEPLNVIISGRSSRSVLEPVGLLLWATAVNFGVSCLGQGDLESLQHANLGDGQPNRTQGTGDGANGVLRYNYESPYVGTCQETFQGGNHFRWWRQNGTEANSGAIFLATSAELPLSQAHLIKPNGYNNGRDELIGNATGVREWEGNRFNTSVTFVPAGLLLNATSENINHADVVAVDGQPAQDGRVAVFTITQLDGSSSLAVSPASSNAAVWPRWCALVAGGAAVLLATI